MKEFKYHIAALFLTLFIAGPLVAQDEEVAAYSVERAAFSERGYDEYAPVLYQNSIVFSANKRMNVLRKYDGDKGKPPWNIFRVVDEGDGEWSRVEVFSEDLRTVTYDGPVTFNSQGNRIYFNRNYDPDNRKVKSKVGIFFAEYSNGSWTGIQPFPHNDPSYNLFHPTLSQDGMKLYFASDMPGGEGQFDLYVCTFERGDWSEPVNLGPQVNSRKNEIYPSIHENGRLFFSTNGWGGVGGYDIFFTEEVNEAWISPVHLPEPFNSKRQDATLISDPGLTAGYITSNRDRWSNSIYEFQSVVPEFQDCEFQDQDSYCFVFFETGTMDIDTTNFMYEWTINNKVKIRGKEAPYCFDGPGDFTARLDVLDMLTGAVLFNEADYEFSITDKVHIGAPDTVVVNQAIELDGSKTYMQQFNADRFYWDTGDYARPTGTRASHYYYKPGIYTIQLGVTENPGRVEITQKACTTKKIVVLPEPSLAGTN